MKIDVYCSMYNEEKMLPYWLRHYEAIADRIFVWEDGSTDSTKEILTKHPKVILLPKEGLGLDAAYSSKVLFPQYEKYSRGVSDWVFAVDADEFVYHPYLKAVLKEQKRQGKDVIQCNGFSMISEKFPTTSGQIYDEVQMGVKDRLISKWAIHSPEARVRYRKGRHGRPYNSGELAKSPTKGNNIKLLHYRFLGKEFIDNRDRNLREGKNRVPYLKTSEYNRDAIRTCPDNSKMNIHEWLALNKDKASNVISVKREMTKLCTLGSKYGTDRHPNSKHGYTPFYYELFKDRRMSAKKILEIGVGEGPGLRMWRDFFLRAKIYGADNEPSRIFKKGRIEVFLCDQSKKSDLESLLVTIGGNIDFVVDDGSHVPEHQVLTCLTLMPHLRKDVIYVIEDVLDLDSVERGLADYSYYIPPLVPARRQFNKWGKEHISRLVVVENKNDT